MTLQCAGSCKAVLIPESSVFKVFAKTLSVRMVGYLVLCSKLVMQNYFYCAQNSVSKEITQHKVVADSSVGVS